MEEKRCAMRELDRIWETSTVNNVLIVHTVHRMRGLPDIEKWHVYNQDSGDYYEGPILKENIRRILD